MSDDAKVRIRVHIGGDGAVRQFVEDKDPFLAQHIPIPVSPVPGPATTLLAAETPDAAFGKYSAFFIVVADTAQDPDDVVSNSQALLIDGVLDEDDTNLSTVVKRKRNGNLRLDRWNIGTSYPQFKDLNAYGVVISTDKNNLQNRRVLLRADLQDTTGVGIGRLTPTPTLLTTDAISGKENKTS